MSTTASIAAPLRFNVIDTHTGRIVNKTPYASRIAANRRADRLDNAYGAYRYRSTPVA